MACSGCSGHGCESQCCNRFFRIATLRSLRMFGSPFFGSPLGSWILSEASGSWIECFGVIWCLSRCMLYSCAFPPIYFCLYPMPVVTSYLLLNWVCVFDNAHMLKRKQRNLNLFFLHPPWPKDLEDIHTKLATWCNINGVQQGTTLAYLMIFESFRTSSNPYFGGQRSMVQTAHQSSKAGNKHIRCFGPGDMFSRVALIQQPKLIQTKLVHQDLLVGGSGFDLTLVSWPSLFNILCVQWKSEEWNMCVQVVPGQAGGGSFKFETPIAYRTEQRLCL